MGIYENIKKAAELRGSSISQIEKDLSLPRSSLQKYNTHTPSADKIYAIAKHLNVSMEYLLTGDVEATKIDKNVEEAILLYSSFEKADPEVQKMINYLLKSE